jgi:hypothetical protein
MRETKGLEENEQENRERRMMQRDRDMKETKNERRKVDRKKETKTNKLRTYTILSMTSPVNPVSVRCILSLGNCA